MFTATGTWGRASAKLYDALVARGQEGLYDQLCALYRGAREGELLDVGCGPGHAALRLAGRHPGLRLRGVDTSAEMVRIAGARAARSGLSHRVRFQVGDALALPFPDQRFDGALSLASIKHWPDRDRGLAELHRVLRPGAAVLIVEADRGASDATLDGYARRWPWLPAAALRLAFRAHIARGSLDRAEARALLDRSPFGGGELFAVEGTPLWALRAMRPLTP